MDSTPDEAIISIFQVYVHDLSGSPFLLRTISRRWNDLSVSSAYLWTRFVVYIYSVQTIVDLLYGRGKYNGDKSNIRY